MQDGGEDGAQYVLTPDTVRMAVDQVTQFKVIVAIVAVRCACRP